MCGITGFCSKEDALLLKSMSNELYHRGPDEKGQYESPKVSFSMRRLSIVDLLAGQQPYLSENKKIVVVFNGEIYNYKKIRNELEKDKYSFSSLHSDGEIIPNLYLKYGKEFVNYLNGMFAIALYDKEKEKILLYRDRIGKKPLYYAIINQQLYFASEIKALLKINYKFNIDKKSLVNYLQLKNTSAPNTIYKEIKQLLPGSYLEYDLDSAKYNIQTYWKPDFQNKIDLDEKKIENNIIKILEDSVNIRTQCDVEYGSYLSGGVDSSLITSIISKNINRNIKTFSLGYEDKFTNKEDDLYFARKVSKKLGTKHHEMILSSREVFSELGDILKSFDEPFSGTISTYFLSKLISNHVKVALSGDGADELFGSYLTHRLSNPIEYYINNIKGKPFLNLNTTDIFNIKPFESFAQYEFLKKMADKSISNFRDKLNVFNSDELNMLFNDNKIYSAYNKFDENLTSENMLDKCLEIDHLELLPNQILPFVDRLSMAHSVEVRVPFMDYRLIDYVASIPSSLKINNGINKYILKKAASKYLDNNIINRKKEGFVLPVYNWIEKEYFNIVKETVLNNSLMIEDFAFNRVYIEKLFKEFLEGTQHHAKIWNLYSLAIWYKGIK